MIHPICFLKRYKMFCSKRIWPGKALAWLVWILAIVLLLSAGIAYRVLASRLKLIVSSPITLPVPLSTFPTQVGNWMGTDLVIPATTKAYMERHFADEFLSRRYINTVAQAWADVYIVYCSSRPGGILGHRPRVCYPAHGWILDSTEPSQFNTLSGQQIPCLIHRLHKPAPMHDQTVVLNFYILNGRIVTDESEFSGPLGRRPNITGDPAKYVAQVQISSALENSIRMAAEQMTDLILDYLPDKNGKVRATEFRNAGAGQLK